MAPPFWFAVLLASAGVAAAHEVLGTQTAAYLDPPLGPARWLAVSAGAAGALAGALLERRLPGEARDRLPWLLAATSLSTTLSAPALLFAFADARLFTLAVLGVPALAGLALGATFRAAASALGRSLLGLGALDRALDPFRLLGVALLLGLAAAAAANVGLLRTAAAIGMVLAALASWCAPLFAFLERRPLARARAGRTGAAATFALALGAFAAAEALVPLGELSRFANPVVYAARSERASYVVTSGQGAFELFVDGKLALSGIDERRYHEALVHPALLAAPRKQRVLVLGGGHGAVVREVLRHREVREITLVAPDAALVELGRRLVWLRRLSGDALATPALKAIEGEPAVWLGEAADRFDVAIVDLPDPVTHVDGKNYTRHFYRSLRRRMTPDGVVVVQGTSPFGSPRTYATIAATLRAAGLATRRYRAPVPTFGDWGFVLAAEQEPRVDPGALAGWLSGATPGEALTLPADLSSPEEPGVSTLFDQVVVETFAEERAKLGP